jgi:polysaccharide pyruvyl transferase WcaK-like protein
MKTLRVLQLASFEGNLGDNANIVGTRTLLRKNLAFNLEFENLEIREFFWGKRHYNEEFADFVNKFDLFIFGGGNFFELWVDHSCNNTSVDIDISILEKIKTPTVFYSLGMDSGMGVSEIGINKFKKWLDYIFENDRFVLSLRNDGSSETAEKYLGTSYARHFHQVPDGGFFTEVKNYCHIEIPKKSTVFGLNLAGDMLDIRFPRSTKSSISYEEFLRKLANLFNNLFEENDNLHLILFPHIYKDLDIIYQFISKLKDEYARRRTTVAPYVHGFDAQSYIFDAYTKCDIIMGNRFHTNVCAIGLNVPTIGFVNYPQIKNLYKELNLEERAVFVNKLGFDNKLKSLIEKTLDDISSIKKEYLGKVDSLYTEKSKFHSYINNWLQTYY